MQLQFYIEGQHAEKAAHDFMARITHLTEGKAEMTDHHITKTGPVRHVDPLALATFVVSIPSAILATADLIARIKSKKNAQTLIDISRDINNTYNQTIRIRTADNQLIAIHTTDSETLLNCVAEGRVFEK